MNQLDICFYQPREVEELYMHDTPGPPWRGWVGTCRLQFLQLYELPAHVKLQIQFLQLYELPWHGNYLLAMHCVGPTS